MLTDPIRFAIGRPVAISACVLIVLLFGLIGIGAIPIQLTPTVDRPLVTVTTAWPGRGPEEIVDEIASRSFPPSLSRSSRPRASPSRR